MMKAIEILGVGGPSCLHITSRPRPEPGAGEVRIKVAAVGMNRADILQRMGKHPPPPGVTDIPGLEVSGNIEAVGTGVSPDNIGRPVCALLAGGGYAEYAVAPLALCLDVAPTQNLIDAAGIPEAIITITKNIFVLAGLARGEHVLIQGGSSGIGTLGIQMAKIFGAKVSTTASSAEKIDLCLRLGADRVIDYKTQSLTDALKSDPVDVVLDMVGGDMLPQALSVMAQKGRLVSIAFLGGSKSQIDLPVLMKKQLTITGSMLRHDTLEDKAAYIRLAQNLFQTALQDGRIKPVIHRTYKLEEAEQAHASFETGQHAGKIILTL